MSIIQGTITSVGDDSYEIDQSIRFNAADASYLQRTFSSDGNLTTWTYSVWFKRSAVGGGAYTVMSAGADNQNDTLFYFGPAGEEGTLDVFFRESGTIGGRITSHSASITNGRIFRDPSAWMHFVLVWDTTNSTAGDRLRLYINGERVTTDGFTITNPSLNDESRWNTARANYIGKMRDNATNYFDGYKAEINFIDGTALDATSFGKTNDDGVWVPKAYTGSYGTNGFYITGETASNLGEDFSGNNNDFTSSGLTSADSVSDSPSDNFATWNPLVPLSNGSFSDGNLEFTQSGGSISQHAKSTISFTSGEKKVCEMQTVSGSSITLGICDEDFIADANGFSGDSRGYFDTNGNKVDKDGNSSSYGASFSSSNVIRIEVDLTSSNGTIEFFKDGVSQGDAFTDIDSTKTWFFWCRCKADAVKANFGQLGFAGTPTTGFTALSTANLPTPSITDGSAHFQPTLYTGTGSSQAVTQSGNSTFQPDWVWIKGRSGATEHVLTDAVRGVTKELSSNDNGAEETVAQGLTTFGSAGFTVGTDGSYNTSSATYVGWQWAANGAGSSNTDGSITSTVSANTTAGFSIVKYTGTGANATVGHGLGVVPKMIFIKDTTNVESWIVYNETVGNDANLYLNLQNAKETQAIFNNTTPTSSVFSLGAIDGANKASGVHVAYCFAEIPGYSSFGKYVGNASVDGPFIYTGFAPEFIMVKSSSNGTTNWDILDATRETFNTRGNQLLANSNVAEASNDHECDFLSNGFKWRDGSTSNNGIGYTIIYMAFAEHPFGGDGVAPATAR